MVCNCTWDKDRIFWRNILWSDVTKIELFGHNDHRYVWRKRGCLQAEEHHPKREARCGSIMLWECFAAGETGALYKIDFFMG